jgi:hypothetical protein
MSLCRCWPYWLVQFASIGEKALKVGVGSSAIIFLWARTSSGSVGTALANEEPTRRLDGSGYLAESVERQPFLGGEMSCGPANRRYDVVASCNGATSPIFYNCPGDGPIEPEDPDLDLGLPGAD